MKNCIVFQPFDKGEYDRRYNEVYRAAIEAAGFKPYRVDEDLSVDVPIEQIENIVSTASAVFADITIDNPNVWLEVGLAVAHKRPLCLVCGEERTKLPFDIQHRSVLKYGKSNPSEFKALSEGITEKLKIIGSRKLKESPVDSSVFRGEKEGILDMDEVSALTVISSVFGEYGDEMSIFSFRESMQKNGIEKSRSNIILKRLEDVGFIEFHTVSDMNGDYKAVRTSDIGWKWLSENKNMHSHALSYRKFLRRSEYKDDGEIPF